MRQCAISVQPTPSWPPSIRLRSPPDFVVASRIAPLPRRQFIEKLTPLAGKRRLALQATPVVMKHLPFHKQTAAAPGHRSHLRNPAVHARLSSRSNPIEQVFAKLKALPRKAKERTTDDHRIKSANCWTNSPRPNARTTASTPDMLEFDWKPLFCNGPWASADGRRIGPALIDPNQCSHQSGVYR